MEVSEARRSVPSQARRALPPDERVDPAPAATADLVPEEWLQVVMTRPARCRCRMQQFDGSVRDDEAASEGGSGVHPPEAVGPAGEGVDLLDVKWMKPDPQRSP